MRRENYKNLLMTEYQSDWDLPLPRERQIAGDGEMVARVTGEIRNRPAWGKGAEAPARDEVEAEGKNAALVQNSAPDGAGNVEAIFKSREIDRAGGEGIVERLPGEAGRAKFLEERLVRPGSEDARFHVRAEKVNQSLKSVQGVATVERVGIEVTGDNGRSSRNVRQKELNLALAAAGCAEHFKVSIGHGDGSAHAAVQTNNQGVAVAVALLLTFRVIEAGRKAKIAGFKNGKSRKSGVALKGGGVLARREEFFANSFGEFLERWSEHDLHAQALPYFISDAAIAGSRHTVVDLVEAQDFGTAN